MDNPNDLAQTLQRTPFFQGLDDGVLTELAQHAVARSFAPGAVIFLEGDTAPGFYYVAAGWVKIVRMSPEGREQILYFWGPGDLFGGMGVFANHPTLATAIALEETNLWLLPGPAIRQTLAADPQLALRLIEFLAGRVEELMTLVTDLSLRSVIARLARQLLVLADGEIIQRRRWATQSQIAARLGTTPDVANRALRTLVEEGVIELSRRQIRILDRERLTLRASPDR
ncbi:MAG: Crp/Fnr family transcriptional regulator [Caldilineaceae bacterium]|nr:Crp/Fnr family transcriptional regulator [Caldilineaceae bacterium]